MFGEDNFSFPNAADQIPDSAQGLISSKKKSKNEVGAFHSMGLSENILKAIKKKGYRMPTPIQRKSIPILLTGKDAVLMARTGSGKTAAFVLPMIQKLGSHSKTVGARALVIAPTRELIKQTHIFVKELGKFSDLRSVEMVGGESMDANFESLAKNPDIIIATPGRLLHIIKETGLSLKAVEYIVFDEADRLFEMGLKEQILDIVNRLPQARQTLLVSATLPSVLAEFVKVGLHNPEIIRLDIESKLSEELKMAFFLVRKEEKYSALIYLLRELITKNEQSIIFASTKHHCDFIYELLNQYAIESVQIYGSMDQSARNHNLLRFRKKDVHFMVVTDVAARGIDIPTLDNVVNFDFPPKPKVFVHRVGRAARAGRTGTAFSLLTLEELPYLIELHMFLGRSLKSKVSDDLKEDEERVKSNFQKDKNKRKLLNYYDGFFGTIPQSILDSEIEVIQKILKDKAEVKALHQVCERAFKLYVQTRGVPAPEYIRKAKHLQYQVHPLFETIVPKHELQNITAQGNLISAIGSYRPKQTVFEIGAQNTAQSKLMEQRRTFKSVKDVFKPKRKKNDDDDDDDDDDENDDKKEEEKQVEEEKEEEEEVKPKSLKDLLVSDKHKKKRFLVAPNSVEQKSFKDERFYISYEPDKNRQQLEFDDKHLKVDGAAADDPSAYRDSLKEASMDLLGENREDLNRSKQVTVWDKKKGKYVRVNSSEAAARKAGRRVKNESGAVIKENDKKDIYNRWKKKTKARIQQVGETEDKNIFAYRTRQEKIAQEREEREEAEAEENGTAGKKRKGGNNKKHPGQQRRDTVLNLEQVQKKRRDRQKREKVLHTRQMFKKYGRNNVLDQLQLDGMAKAAEKRKREREGFNNSRGGAKRRRK